VPAWAVSLGAAALLQAAILAIYGTQLMTLRTPDAQLSSGDFAVGTVLFVLLSLGGAVIFAVPAVRDALCANRAADAAPRFAVRRLSGALVGFAGSSALAGLAGVLLARRLMAAIPPIGSELLPMALGAALLGGVSIFGRRGGIAGVVLAVGVLSLIRHWMALAGADAWTQTLLAGVAIAVGLIVSRLIELAARLTDRPRPADARPADARPADREPAGGPP
jgi:ribose/xylose/arabinose/galactoside ABC-type transport system permease subunit